MVKIRLQRIGRKNRPYYRIVVTPSETKRDGKYIEKIGSYDPIDKKYQLDQARFQHWIDHGAQPTTKVAQLAANKLAGYQKSR